MHAKKVVNVLLVAAAVLPLAWPLRAEILDKETCDQLKDELSKLEATGVRADMDRGAEWGKANLAPPRLGQIQRLMSIDEQLMFRCRTAKLPKDLEAAIDAALKPPAPAPAPAAPAAPAAPDGEAGAAAPVGQPAGAAPTRAEVNGDAKPASKPDAKPAVRQESKPRPSAKPKAAQPVTVAPPATPGAEKAGETGDSAEPAPKPAKKPKRVAKPKADDAFRPPPGTESLLQAPPGVAPVAAPEGPAGKK